MSHVSYRPRRGLGALPLPLGEREQTERVARQVLNRAKR